METYAINAKIEEDAASCTDTAQTLFSLAEVHATPEYFSKMLVVLKSKRIIKRNGHENRYHTPIPTGLDFELPEKYKQTLNEEDFVLEDLAVLGSKKRYLVFFTSQNIDVLNNYGNWFIDRTLRAARKIYTRSKQCIVLLTAQFSPAFTHYFVDDTTFPRYLEINEAIQRQRSLQAFLSQLQLEKKRHARKEDNFRRIKRIIWSAANYEEIDFFKAIAVDLTF